jgi:arylesterase/paraoxonase
MLGGLAVNRGIPMKLLKRLLAVVGILVVVAGAATAWLLGRGGAFKSLEPHFAGRCEALPLEGSGEDILVDRERGIAYLSLLDRRSLVEGKDVQGTVARVDLNSRPFTAVSALATQPAAFRPHGLSLYVAPDGSRRLFVINHGQERGVDPEAVEIFDETSPGEFTHAETVRGAELHSPNDLVAVGPRQFYVANDKPLGGGLAAGLQQVGIGGSGLSYFDGPDGRYVLEDIASGGGINASADRGTLYVAETAGKRVRVLARQANGDVSEVARIPMETSPDNIDVAADGSIWVTGHANTLALIRHFIAGSPAPTQVWRVVPADGAAGSPEEIYLDDGTQMSAGSVGATFNDLLLIGSITERKILVCTRTP